MKRSWIVLSASIVLGLTACGSGTTTSPTSSDSESPTASQSPEATETASDAAAPSLPDTITIGASLPLSGQIAQIGIDARRGMELAQADASELLGSEVVIDFRDDAFEKEQSIVNFERLLQDQPAGLVGPLGSLISSAALPIAQDKGVPAITLSAPDNGLTDTGDMIFSSLPMMSEQGPTVALDALDDAGIAHDKAFIAKSEDYQTGLIYMDAMTAALQDRGSEVAGEVSFFEADTNFTTQVTAISAAEPDIIFISGGNPAVALFVKQLRSSGVETPVVGDIGTAIPPFLEQAGDAAEGVIGLVYWDAGSESATGVSDDFVAAYEEANGDAPTLYSAVGYDTVMSLARAIAQADSVDPAAVRDALASLEPYEGVMGPALTYSENRTMASTPVAVTWQDGALVPLAG